MHENSYDSIGIVWCTRVRLKHMASLHMPITWTCQWLFLGNVLEACRRSRLTGRFWSNMRVLDVSTCGTPGTRHRFSKIQLGIGYPTWFMRRSVETDTVLLFFLQCIERGVILVILRNIETWYLL